MEFSYRRRNDIQNSDFLGLNKYDYSDVKPIKQDLIYEVYKAKNVKDNRKVCLKVYNKNILKKGDYDFFIEMINREEEIVKLCKSENIVNIYRRLENKDYIIFEKESWEISLADFIEQTGGIFNKAKSSLFKEILLGMVNALKVLNEKGVIHRDIKPSNFFITTKTFDKLNKSNIKLGGFDYSIYIKENTSESVGSYFYAAPEIIKNLEYDEKCDLWSLGITLYELLFGELPYGKYVTINTIKQSIYYQDNFNYKKTGTEIIDDLLNKLLIINRKNRIHFEDLFNYLTKNVKCIENFSFQIFSHIIKPSNKNNKKNLYLNENQFTNKIVNIIEGGYLPDIMDFSNDYVDPSKKFNNIIYYDENISYMKSIKENCVFFEKNTNGAFIFCNNLESIRLLREEILKQIKKDKRTIFNLITSGSACKKIMDLIVTDTKFDNCFKNVCVFCKNLDNYKNLKKEYPKIHDDIYNDKEKVINFINEKSENSIKVFQITKLLTMEDYKEKYNDRHLKISEFYRNKNLCKYEEIYYNKITKIIEKDELKKDLKLPKGELLKGLDSFRKNNVETIEENNEENIDYLEKILIKEYTRNTFYGDLNKWLMNFNMNFYDYESVAYFTGRLMYSLNSYAIKNQKFFNSNDIIIYRGIKIPYSSLLSYERAKGKIILLTSFTSTSLSVQRAEEFSGRNNSKELYKTNLLFSVLLIIKNIWKEGWISNGINIQDVAVFQIEKEILFQPFSFYYLSDIKINLEKYTADIYLETVGKKQILENEISEGKEITYDISENIVELIEKKKEERK